jgi:hypothetical protein
MNRLAALNAQRRLGQLSGATPLMPIRRYGY